MCSICRTVLPGDKIGAKYLLLFLADGKVSHESLGEALTDRQAEGTRQLHDLHGLGRAVRGFCTVHKLIQQLISVKESKMSTFPNPTPSKMNLQQLAFY